MTFVRSILVLTAVCLCVGFAYFAGHALSVHSMTPVFLGLALLAVGAAFIYFVGRRDRERHGDPHHWV
jgi:hypothetical protein